MDPYIFLLDVLFSKYVIISLKHVSNIIPYFRLQSSFSSSNAVRVTKHVSRKSINIYFNGCIIWYSVIFSSTENAFTSSLIYPFVLSCLNVRPATERKNL